MNRFKAAGIHLAISCLIGLFVLSWLWLVWYPGALFTLTGGLSLLTILLCVDIIVGPLITLVIFDVKKKSLKSDLICVAILQMAALMYGFHSMWLARPVWLAYSYEGFEIVSVPDIAGGLHEAKPAALQALPALGPKLIGILPNRLLRGKLEIEVGLKTGAKMPYFPQAWQPYEHVKQDVLKHARPLGALEKEQHGALLMKKLESRYAGTSPAPVWLPLRGGQKDGIVLIDAKSAEFLDTFTF